MVAKAFGVAFAADVHGDFAHRHPVGEYSEVVYAGLAAETKVFAGDGLIKVWFGG